MIFENNALLVATFLLHVLLI